MRALRDLDRLAARGFVVSDAVLAEALHLLPTRPARARLAALVDELPMRPWSPERAADVRREAFEWATRYVEHDPDWADALLVVAASHEPRARVWTYDSAFTTTWRRLDGKRVPLATR